MLGQKNVCGILAAMVCASVRHDEFSCREGGKEEEDIHFT